MERATAFLQSVQRRSSSSRIRRLGQTRLLHPIAAKLGHIARTADFTTKVRGVTMTMPGYVDYYTEEFESSTLDWLAQNLRPGFIAADIGAHIGFLTLIMARLCGETGRVYSFEPAPQNLDYLNRNIAQNAATNVVVVPKGAGASSATRTLYLVEDGDMDSFFPGNPSSRAAGTIDVEQVAVDEVVPRIDVAKIDVEGGEIEVLLGMQRLLAQDPKPILVVEWSPTLQVVAGHAPEELIEVLHDSGYSPVLLGSPTEGETLDDAILRLRAGALPAKWYANLVCVALDGLVDGEAPPSPPTTRESQTLDPRPAQSSPLPLNGST